MGIMLMWFKQAWCDRHCVGMNFRSMAPPQTPVASAMCAGCCAHAAPLSPILSPSSPPSLPLLSSPSDPTLGMYGKTGEILRFLHKLHPVRPAALTPGEFLCHPNALIQGLSAAQMMRLAYFYTQQSYSKQLFKHEWSLRTTEPLVNEWLTTSMKTHNIPVDLAMQVLQVIQGPPNRAALLAAVSNLPHLLGSEQTRHLATFLCQQATQTLVKWQCEDDVIALIGRFEAAGRKLMPKEEEKVSEKVSGKVSKTSKHSSEHFSEHFLTYTFTPTIAAMQADIITKFILRNKLPRALQLIQQYAPPTAAPAAGAGPMPTVLFNAISLALTESGNLDELYALMLKQRGEVAEDESKGKEGGGMATAAAM